MQINNNAPVSSNGPASSSGAAGHTDGQSFQSLLSQLNGYTGSTPGQGMWNSMLAQLGVTPQQYADMTPAEQAKIEQKIEQLMKKEMQAQEQMQQQPGQAPQSQQAGVAHTGKQSGTSGNQSDGSSPKQRTGIDISI